MRTDQIREHELAHLDWSSETFTSARSPDSLGHAEDTYQGLRLRVYPAFARHAELILRYQKTAITRGAIYDVSRPTKVYIVGWLSGDYQMACVQLALPHFSRQKLESMPWVCICTVEENGVIVGGFVAISLRECMLLHEDESKFTDLADIEKEFSEILVDMRSYCC